VRRKRATLRMFCYTKSAAEVVGLEEDRRRCACSWQGGKKKINWTIGGHLTKTGDVGSSEKKGQHKKKKTLPIGEYP